MSEEFDNRARRLHRILAEAAAQTDGNITARQLWAAIFDVRPKDTMQIYRRLVALSELTDEVEVEIKTIPGISNHERLLSWRTDVRTVLTSGSIDIPWAGQRSLLGDATLQSLGFCADRLDEEGFREKPIPPEDLRDLASKVDELFNHVADSTLDPQLREVILDSLEAIRQAIAEYRIRGVAGLATALARARGQVLVHLPRMEEEVKKGNSLVKRFGGVMRTVDDVIARAGKYRHLLVGAVSLVSPEAAVVLALLTSGDVPQDRR